METGRILHEILREVKKAVVGKDEVILKVLLAGMARGHVLLEDLPGGGKDHPGCGLFAGDGSAL